MDINGGSGRIAVLGAGGHAKVVVSTLQATGHALLTIFDDDSSKWGGSVLGVRVAGPVSAIREDSQYEFGVVAIGNNQIRKRIAENVPLQWLTLVHPASYVHPSVNLGLGTVVLAGAVIQPDATVGDHVIVNTAVSIDHDCVIDNFVHIAPGSHMAGGVHVGLGAFLGIGSAVTPGRTIGPWTTVGAGGVVVHDLPAGVVAVGVPAKPRNPLIEPLSG